MEKIVRMHLIFHGTVQGVGFRWRAETICRSLGLTGWVRNLWDDTVEMEVQGRSGEIEEMERQMNRQHFIEITFIDRSPLPPDPHESSFQVID